MSQEKQTLPFFTRYLENQSGDMSAEELNEVSGGAIGVTEMYPSDGDAADSGYSSRKPQNPFDLPSFEFPTFPASFPFNSNDDTVHAL
jgi:Serine endopeptidase inhibitors